MKTEEKGKQRGEGGGGDEGAVTHSPGSVCNQAAEGGSSIRAQLSAVPACTGEACVIAKHTWMQELLRHEHVHTHTQSDVCAVTHTNCDYSYRNHTCAHTHSAGSRYCSHSDLLCSFVVLMWHAKLITGCKLSKQ